MDNIHCNTLCSYRKINEIFCYRQNTYNSKVREQSFLKMIHRATLFGYRVVGETSSIFH
jgi:hypothetical protein